jgi:molecular chaperone GrpE
MTEPDIFPPSTSEPIPVPPSVETPPQIEKLQEEVQEYKDKYLRLLAEIDNMRKRLSKEKQEMTKFAIDNVMAELLGPLDNLEKALSSTDRMSPEVKNWALGFQMILAQFKEVLQNHGILPFSSVGTLFDPHLHEAVEIEETDDKPEGTVLEEYVRGYKSQERIIRPARVKVAKKP